MNDDNVRFQVKIDEMLNSRWSIGICISHWADETYLYINFIKWSISIGFLYD